MKSVLKKVSVVLLALITLATFTGCRDEDVVAGVIIGGVIGGVVAGGGHVTVGVPAHRYAYLSDCEGYRREWICEWSHGGWYRAHRRYHRWDNLLTESAAISSVDSKAQTIQQRWGLTAKSSAKLAQAIEAAKGGELKAFDKIGLSLKELNTLISKNQIDINDLDQVASKLNTSAETALAILNAFTQEYKIQEKDVNSALWNQCLSGGQWKTPQVAACTALDSAGCSPDMGATSCLPL